MRRDEGYRGGWEVSFGGGDEQVVVNSLRLTSVRVVSLGCELLRREIKNITMSACKGVVIMGGLSAELSWNLQARVMCGVEVGSAGQG